MPTVNWKYDIAPSHKCKICGAYWRLWLKEEVPYSENDSWSLLSTSCGSCCDNVPMRGQIEPLKLGDMFKFICEASSNKNK